MSDNILSIVENACKVFDHKSSDQLKILVSATEELGELSKEVLIKHKFKPDTPGKDGITGEAVDLIICALDMIYSEHGQLDCDTISSIVKLKLSKWVEKYS